MRGYEGLGESLADVGDVGYLSDMLFLHDGVLFCVKWIGTEIVAFQDMRLQEIKHRQPSLKQHNNPLKHKKIPNNPSNILPHPLNTKQTHKPLQHKRNHPNIAPINLPTNLPDPPITVRMGDSQHLIKNPHIGHYTVHAAVVFAREEMLGYVFEDEEGLLRGEGVFEEEGEDGVHALAVADVWVV